MSDFYLNTEENDVQMLTIIKNVAAELTLKAIISQEDFHIIANEPNKLYFQQSVSNGEELFSSTNLGLNDFETLYKFMSNRGRGEVESNIDLGVIEYDNSLHHVTINPSNPLKEMLDINPFMKTQKQDYGRSIYHNFIMAHLLNCTLYNHVHDYVKGNSETGYDVLSALQYMVEHSEHNPDVSERLAVILNHDIDVWMQVLEVSPSIKENPSLQKILAQPEKQQKVKDMLKTMAHEAQSKLFQAACQLTWDYEQPKLNFEPN